MPPKKEEPTAVDPLVDSNNEQAEEKRAELLRAMVAKVEEVQFGEASARRLVQEMEAVGWRFISSDSTNHEKPEQSGSKYRVHVKLLSRNRAYKTTLYTLLCSPSDDDVDSLKAQIASYNYSTPHPPVENQVLSYLDKPLQTGTVEVNEIPPEATLHLTIVGTPPSSFPVPPIRFRDFCSAEA